MFSGSRGTSKLPWDKCIVSKGVVHKASTPKEVKGNVHNLPKLLYCSEF